MSAESSLSPYAGLAAKIRPEGSRDAQAIAAQRAAREPILRIVLRPGFVLLRWLAEPCLVLVDGQRRGELRSGVKFEASVPAGRHSVQVTRAWLGSQRVEIEVQNGEIAQFHCTGHNSPFDLCFGLALLFGVLLPSRFYWLTAFRP